MNVTYTTCLTEVSYVKGPKFIYIHDDKITLKKDQT